MALSLARGLAFLHSSDPPFIHRDVKPANCFVFEDPAVVKIGCDDAAPTLQGSHMLTPASSDRPNAATLG